MFSGLRHVLLLLTMFPVAKNNLSEGVDVAGIQITAFASWAMFGNRDSLSFHHSRTFVLRAHTFSFNQAPTSSFIVLPLVSSSGPNRMSSADFFAFFITGGCS